MRDRRQQRLPALPCSLTLALLGLCVVGMESMPRTVRPRTLRALPMPTRDLLLVGDRVTFTSSRVSTEKRGVRVRSGVVVTHGYALSVAEDGRHRRAPVWGLWQIRLRTIRRDDTLIACAPCVPVGPECGCAPPAQPTKAARTPLPPREMDPEEVAHLERLKAESAAFRQAAIDKVRAEAERAEQEVAARRAAYLEQAARIEAASAAREAAYLAQRDAHRATLPPEVRARLERHDRTLQAARERAARPRPRRTLPPEQS